MLLVDVVDVIVFLIFISNGICCVGMCCCINVNSVLGLWGVDFILNVLFKGDLF